MPATAGLLSTPCDASPLRPFAQAEYVDGQLSSQLLDCPFAGVDEPCDVVAHDRRLRKTGPVHDVLVLRCHVHERYFTVYPPGFLPYSRRQLVDGPVQHGVPSLAKAVATTALQGPRPRLNLGEPDGSWSTQNRLIACVSQMFGLGDIDSRIRVATAFDLSLTSLEAASRTNGVQARAAALQPLVDGMTARDLAVLGSLSRCWGRPHRWNASRDILVRWPLCRGSP